MSRHDIPALTPGYTATVGWDRPMGTFFGQVFDLAAPEDMDEVVFSIGQKFREVRTAEELRDAMAPYAIIEPSVLMALTADRYKDGDGAEQGKAWVQRVTGIYPPDTPLRPR